MVVVSRYYTGVGSRVCKDNVILMDKLYDIGKKLALAGYTLRSGHANGPDKAFEAGCDEVKGDKEIFIPWQNFNGSVSSFYTVSDEATALAASVVPHWRYCSDYAKLLHARNCYQVLGLKLNSPSDFLICWTNKGEVRVGTATAIRLAQRNGIPVYNLGLSEYLGVKPAAIVDSILSKVKK